MSLKCVGCGKLIGIEVCIEKRTYWEARTIYQAVSGVYPKPSGKLTLELEDTYEEENEPEIIYQCDYCGEEYTEEKVIRYMLELQTLDEESAK